VDQSHRRGSKIQLDSGNTSSPSSPSLHSEHHSGMQESAHPYMAMPQIQEVGASQTKRQRTGSFSPESKGKLVPGFSGTNTQATAAPIFNRPYDFNNQPSNWVPSEMSPTKANPQDPPGYWRPNDSPLTAGFPPYQPGVPLQTHNWPPSSAIEQSSREELWAMPQRSMSYGNIEGLPANQPAFPYQSVSMIAPGQRGEMVPRQTGRESYSGPTGASVASSLGSSGATLSMTDAPTPTSMGDARALGVGVGVGGVPPYTGGQNWQGQGYTFAAVPKQGDNYSGWAYGGVPGQGLGSQGHGHAGPLSHAQGLGMYSQGEQIGGIYYPNASHGG
jgi:hypothetical protein